MASSYKAVALANELFNELTKRLSALAATSSQSFDTNGNPTIIIASTASPATTQKNAFIRILPLARPLALTSIGTTPDLFVPTVTQFATEAPAAGAGHTSDFFTPADLINLYGPILRRGTRVEMYQSANGTVPVVGTLIAANLQIGYEANIYWGLLSSQ